VIAACVASALLHLLWARYVADAGGDLAAQDAWAAFARTHPNSAYDLAWYGGIHPVSYSAISPYIMAVLGVRTTMVLTGTVSAAILGYLLIRTRAVRRPLWPALYGAFGLTGNAVSGRATFGLGLMFGLAAVTVTVAWPQDRRSPKEHIAYRVLVGLLAATATAASPVAGLFLGMVAAAMWLAGHRRAGLALGLPPAVLVALSAWLFPFSGRQPMHALSVILPVLVGLACLFLSPPHWRSVRIGSALYVAGVLAAWVVPSPVGSNVTRMGLVFGGVLLVAVAATNPSSPQRLMTAASHTRSGRALAVLAVAIVASTAWQAGTATSDAIRTRPGRSLAWSINPLLAMLRTTDAHLGRVEAVPTRSHREATALAPYFNLARGWNRQADADRNPIFYRDEPLTAATYRDWLDRWAVRYIVLSADPPDDAAIGEAALVSAGLPYLRKAWSSSEWTLYEVKSPAPLADPPAVVTRFDAAALDLQMPTAGEILIRIPDSPWLSLVDDQGNALRAPGDGCLSAATTPPSPDAPSDRWTVLHAPRAGTYRIAAPYAIPRGTACPQD